MKYAMILSNNERSYEYLKLLISEKKFPNFIIYLDFKGDEKVKKKIFSLIYKKKLNHKSFKGNSVDKKNISDFIIKLKDKIIIYSGYGGKIIKNKSIFKNKIFLHSHTGKLPKYKGSTTIYYSLIKERKIYCSTFIMNSQIDKGAVLLVKEYPLINNYKNIDNYDNKIRAKNICQVLNNFYKLNKAPKKFKENYSPYYIIHPILRYIALKKKTFYIN